MTQKPAIHTPVSPAAAHPRDRYPVAAGLGIARI